MSSAAQRNEMAGTFDFPAPPEESVSPLKDIVAEHLAAHRTRRAEQAEDSARGAAALQADLTSTRQGSKRVRDKVAARYQQATSYREFLAAEAERALQQAQAEAEMAARKAKAVAEVQLQLLEELEQWDRNGQALNALHAEARGELAHALADIALGAQELIQETAASASLEPAERIPVGPADCAAVSGARGESHIHW